MLNIDKLRADLTDAVRAKDSHKTETLRGLIASIHNEEIARRSKEGNSTLSETQMVAVLQKEAKKRKESAEVYGGAGRSDLENKERAELAIIEEYLPAGLKDEEVLEIVKGIVSGGEDNFGKVMGMAMKEVAGRADSQVVSAIVKELLGET